MDKYSFGMCEVCKRNGALKNGKCANCRIEMPEFLKDIFGKFGGKNE